MNGTTAKEDVLDADRPIVDAHHHLWDAKSWETGAGHGPMDDDDGNPFRHDYLLKDLLRDVQSGHNVRATVFVECQSMYRADGPEEMKCVGETEFVNGIAAMSASGVYGSVRACAAIIAKADLALGRAVEPVLDAHLRFSDSLRGVRATLMWDADELFRFPGLDVRPRMAEEPQFREGVKLLGQKGLSLDVLTFHPQAPEMAALARACPDTTIVINHIGFPLGVGPYANRRDAVFDQWRAGIRAMGECPNIVMKMGAMSLPWLLSAQPVTTSGNVSERLASQWRPFVEACIDAFGPERCMFAGNFPVDRPTGDYVSIWNAFKRITQAYGESEKDQLFSKTAMKTYRIALPGLQS